MLPCRLSAFCLKLVEGALHGFMRGLGHFYDDLLAGFSLSQSQKSSLGSSGAFDTVTLPMAVFGAIVGFFGPIFNASGAPVPSGYPNNGLIMAFDSLGFFPEIFMADPTEDAGLDVVVESLGTDHPLKLEALGFYLSDNGVR